MLNTKSLKHKNNNNYLMGGQSKHIISDSKKETHIVPTNTFVSDNFNHSNHYNHSNHSNHQSHSNHNKH